MRTNRHRLLVGLDIAQAEHVVHLRHAHTRVVVPPLTIPNTTRGFTQLWARIQQAQRATGCREVVCGLEPTGTYHEAVAPFLEAQGADVVLISSSVAYWNRRTQDGTWDKHDRKDAANCADLLEQGKVLFYSQPDGPARGAAPPGQVPPPGPGRTGGLQGPLAHDAPPGPRPDGRAAPEPPPGRAARRAAGLGAGGPRAARGRRRGGSRSGWPRPVPISGPRSRPCRPASRRSSRRSRPWPSGSRPTRSSGRSRGSGPRWAAILLAEIGDIAWFTKFSQLRKLAGLDIVRVQSGQFAGQARISKCGRGLLRWALYHAAMGLARTAAGRARLAALKAKRHGDRFAGFKAIVELAAKVLRIVWGVWRSGTPYDPRRTGGLQRQPR